jgi:serine/threonine protein kinase
MWSLGVITFMSLYGQAPFSDTPSSPKFASSGYEQAGQGGQAGQVGQVGQVGETVGEAGEAPNPMRSSSAVFSTALQRAPEAEDLLDTTREPPSEIRRRAIEHRRRIGMLLSSDSDSEDPAAQRHPTSDSKAGEVRQSEAGEVRQSEVRQSEAGEVRQSEAGEVRQSEAGEARQSEAGEVRQSEAVLRSLTLESEVIFPIQEAGLRVRTASHPITVPPISDLGDPISDLGDPISSHPIAVPPTSGTPSSNGLHSRRPAGLRNLEVRDRELLPADHGASSSISPQISPQIALGIPLHPLLKPSSPSVVLSADLLKPSSPSVVLSAESPLIQRRMALLARSSSGVFTYPERDDVSATARKFISQLLQVDPRCRLSALEALSHIWLQRRSRAASLDESFLPGSDAGGTLPAAGTPTPIDLSPTSRSTDASASPERPQRSSSTAQMGGEGGGTAVEALAERVKLGCEALAEPPARASPLVSRCAAGTTARNLGYLGSSPITPPDSREREGEGDGDSGRGGGFGRGIREGEGEGEGDSADGDGTPPGVRLVSSRRPSGILPSSSEDEPEDDGVEERPGSFRRAGGGSRSSSQRMTRPPPIARSRPAPARPRSMTSEF